MRLFVFIFLISLISYSQIPTLDENNNWTRIGWSFWAGGYVDLDIITILGEQVINGKTYKIIYRDGELTNCRLREENGVIYSFEENINDEKIMINLNLEVGDVLNEDYFCLSMVAEALFLVGVFWKLLQSLLLVQIEEYLHYKAMIYLVQNCIMKIGLKV